MTTTIDSCPISAEQEGAQWPGAVKAVLHFAARLLEPFPEVSPTPQYSEHFGHAEKRNDLVPQWSSEAGHIG